MSAAGVCNRPTALTVDQHWRVRWQSSVGYRPGLRSVCGTLECYRPPHLSVEEAHEKISVDYENEIINRARFAAHVPNLETK